MQRLSRRLSRNMISRWRLRNEFEISKFLLLFQGSYMASVRGMVRNLSTGSIFGELPVRVQYDEM
jgi:hypothetical protein